MNEGMKEVLERYVRSFKERGPNRRDPEDHQDLGTFVCWLLERNGFRVEARAYRYEDEQRRVDKGKREFGVDIVATRLADESQWWFVLKRGNLTRGNWSNQPTGTMNSDLQEASGLALSKGTPINLVAVHNGDVRDELRDQVDGLLEHLRKQPKIESVDWWNASRLVEMLEANERGAPNTDLFPPTVRPFARMTIDSLALDVTRPGAKWSRDALRQLVDTRLPHGRRLEGDGPDLGRRLAEGDALAAEELWRSGNELALFAHMLESHCRQAAEGNLLPVLDTLENVLCRVVEHLRRLEGPALMGFKEKLKRLLTGLSEHYLRVVLELAEKLRLLARIPFGLALVGTDGEQLNYPLRTFHLASKLALGGLVAHALDKRAQGESLSDLLWDLYQQNVGGFDPVLDDHIIEWNTIWKLWLRLEQHSRIQQSCEALSTRLWTRFRGEWPLPASRIRGTQPIDRESMRALVEVYQSSDFAAHPLFEDSGTTFVAHLAYWSRLSESDELASWWPAMLEPLQTRSGKVRKLFPQSWHPPSDAYTEWYVRDVSTLGVTGSYEAFADVEEAMRALAALHQPLSESTAEAWGVPFVDDIAWVMFRSPILVVGGDAT